MENDKAHIAKLLESICRREDQKAFEEIFRIFYERLINFCIAYIHDKEQAEEIVSTVLLKIWLKRKDMAAVRNLETYLFIAVKNQSLNHLKQFSNYKVVYLEETGMHEVVNAYDAEKELERKELMFRLSQAIETLPTQCRIIFMLAKDEGMKYREVAQILNISPRTVETQLARAVKKLSAVLAPYLGSSKPNKNKRGSSNLFRMFF